MPNSKSSHSVELDLAREVRELSKEVGKLKSLEFIQIFKHPWKFLWFSLLKGMMVGLGTVIGATVLVALVIYMLTQVKVVPIVGSFVEDVIQEIQTGSNK